MDVVVRIAKPALRFFVPYGHLFLHLAILELLEMVALVVYCYTLLAKFVSERKR